MKGSVAEGKLDRQVCFADRANEVGLHSKGNKEPRRHVKLERDKEPQRHVKLERDREPCRHVKLERDVISFVFSVVPFRSRVDDGIS